MNRLRTFLGWEWLLALAVVAGALWSIGHLLVLGFLPPPFHPDPSQTWMDWFSTAWWAHHPGAYDRWRTLYPPVSFLFLNALSLPSCYALGDGAAARGCDWAGVAALHGCYVLDAVLIARTFVRLDRRTAVPRAVALAMGLPMLNALDRGNLILICFAFFALAHGPLLRSARWRAVAFGLTINLKIYLIATLLAPALRRRRRAFAGALVATVALYLLSWALWGSGTPVEIAGNLIGWNRHLHHVTGLREIWSTTAYGPVVSALDRSLVPNGPGWSRILAGVIPAAVGVTQALIVLAAGAAWWRPGAVTTVRVLNLLTLIALITSDGGGYTQVLLIYLTFFERSRGVAVRVALIGCYLLAIPVDLAIAPVDTQVGTSLFHAGPIAVTFWLTYGQLLRPAGVLVVAVALSCATIADVWRGREPIA